MKDKLTPQDSQTLSAYLDDRLKPREKARLEARLQQQSDLRDELEALKQTKIMLRTLPRRRAPRNFTLTPAMAPQRPIQPLFPVFRFASALAGVLFIAAFVGQYVLGSGGPVQSADPGAFALSSNKAMAPAVQSDTVNQSEGANKLPVIIVWGTPTYPSRAFGLGGGGYGGGPVGGANPPEIANSTDANSAAATSAPAATMAAAVPAPGTLSPDNPPTATPTVTEKSGGTPLLTQQENTPTPESPAIAALAPTDNSLESTPLADAHRAANPILGVQPPGEQNTPEATPIISVQEPVSRPFSIWSWVETGLGLAGVTLGLLAYFFYRREK